MKFRHTDNNLDSQEIDFKPMVDATFELRLALEKLLSGVTLRSEVTDAQLLALIHSVALPENETQTLKSFTAVWQNYPETERTASTLVRLVKAALESRGSKAASADDIGEVTTLFENIWFWLPREMRDVSGLRNFLRELVMQILDVGEQEADEYVLSLLSRFLAPLEAKQKEAQDEEKKKRLESQAGQNLKSFSAEVLQKIQEANDDNLAFGIIPEKARSEIRSIVLAREDTVLGIHYRGNTITGGGRGLESVSRLDSEVVQEDDISILGENDYYREVYASLSLRIAILKEALDFGIEPPGALEQGIKTLENAQTEIFVRAMCADLKVNYEEDRFKDPTRKIGYLEYLLLERPVSDIKGAFRQLAMEWHPDTSKRIDAEAGFKVINLAYSTLR